MWCCIWPMLKLTPRERFFFLWEKKQSAQNPNFSTWRMPMSDQVAKLETAAGSFFFIKKNNFFDSNWPLYPFIVD